MTHKEVLFFYENWQSCQIDIYLLCLTQMRTHYHLDKRPATERAETALSRSLKPGGRLVAEFGGKHNICRIAYMPCEKDEQRALKKAIEEWKNIAAIYQDGRKPTYHEMLLKERLQYCRFACL
jgi:hypothetical protein